LVQLAVTAVAKANRDRRRNCMIEKGEAEEAGTEQHSRLISIMLAEHHVTSREWA